MYGGADRSGSREGKKSLRKNKQEIQKKVKAEQKGHVSLSTQTTVSLTPPALLPCEHDSPIVDAAVQLINRQFDRDQVKVLQRSVQAGVCALVAYTTDWDKLDALMRCAKENAGYVYAALGVHSDNIKRSNERLPAARLEALRELSLRPECVALLAGLDYSRDVGLRYAQERAMSEQMELAASVGLPLLLYEVRAADVLAERVTDFRGSGAEHAATLPIALLNYSGGSESELSTLIAQGCHVMVNGRAADPSERGQALRAQLAGQVPLERLMVASDAPFATPQNIQDAFMREGRNEPSNLPYLTDALAEAYDIPSCQLRKAVYDNVRAFFDLTEHAAAEAAAGSAGSNAAATAPTVRPVKAAGTATLAGTGKENEQGTNEEDNGSDWKDEGSQPLGSAKVQAIANRFVSVQLGDEGDQEAAGSSGGEDEQSGAPVQGPGRSNVAFAQEDQQAAGAGPGSEKDAAAAAAAQAGPGSRGGMKASNRPPPRNFVAEYEAAAKARGPLQGPRVRYACRQCRSVLFSEADTLAHEGAEELDRVDFAKAGKKAGCSGRKARPGGKDASACTYVFLRNALPWMEGSQGCFAAEGHVAGEGKLTCPTCAAKIGKWALHSTADVMASTGHHGDGLSSGGLSAGVVCSCGALVPAPAYGLIKQRLDMIDAELDIASAVQSALQAYEEGTRASGGSSSGSEGDEGKRRKRRSKQKANKTANFSSFRNKSYGVKAPAAGGGGGGGGETMHETAHEKAGSKAAGTSKGHRAAGHEFEDNA